MNYCLLLRRSPGIQVILLFFMSSMVILNINRNLRENQSDIIKTIADNVQEDGDSETNFNMNLKDSLEMTDLPIVTKKIRLEHCSCSRTLPITEDKNQPEYSTTTCGRDAFQRGIHQKVAGFSFYGNTTSGVHKSKQYFAGIKENLELLPQLYGPGWSMRLYYDLDQADPLMQDLCGLACENSDFDLCHVRNLPGNPVKDASEIFAMNWRFLPTLDPQVELST